MGPNFENASPAPKKTVEHAAFCFLKLRFVFLKRRILHRMIAIAFGVGGQLIKFVKLSNYYSFFRSSTGLQTVYIVCFRAFGLSKFQVDHAEAVALLLFPAGSQPAKVAGLWVMVAMAGAKIPKETLEVFNDIASYIC